MIIFSPNINVGGGFILLKGLLNALDDEEKTELFLDLRIKGKIKIPSSKTRVHWVERSLLDRMKAEKRLQALSTEGSQILCFNGTPPLLKCRGKIIVYVQNRLLISPVGQYRFRLPIRLRIYYEKLVFYYGKRRVHRFLVQTATMAETLKQWLEKSGGVVPRPKISIAPFFDFDPGKYKSDPAAPKQSDYDFCYIADGQPHKNHQRLLEALVLLAEQEIFPSIALTLGHADQHLIEQIERMKAKYVLQIDNLGALPHRAVIDLYARSKALIYPSTLESFGMPLIEASRLGLPIVAAELNYVRDVCQPNETFDPNSPRSLARAMRRFLEIPEDAAEILSCREFLNLIQRGQFGE